MENQLDPSVVALTKAIGQSESGGNYSAKGKSGEYGAYQYTAPTWKADSIKYLGSDIPLEQATPEQQDKVAYSKIHDLGKQGYKPDQVASIWNSGKPDYQGNVGTNKYGVHFDTPAYVKSVGTNYEKLMNGGQATIDPNNPSSTAAPQTAQTDSRDWLSKTSDVLSAIFGGGKIGEAIGAQKVKSDILNGNNGTQEVDYSKLTPEAVDRLKAKGVPTTLQGQREETASQVTSPTAGQLAGDVGKIALTAAAPFVGGETIAGRLAGNAALGAGLGLTDAVANKGDVGKETLSGAGVGLAGGAVGEIAGKLLSVLPRWFVGAGLKGIDEAGLQTALERKFTNIPKALEESEMNIKTASSKIRSILSGAPEEGVVADTGVGLSNEQRAALSQEKLAKTKPVPNSPAYPKDLGAEFGGDTMTAADRVPTQKLNPQGRALGGYADNTGLGDQAIRETANAFPNSELGSTPDGVISIIKKVAQKNSKLIDKIASGEATLYEKNLLRQELDLATKKAYSDSPELTFNKQVAYKFAQSLRREVQRVAPETVPLFDELEKEIPFNKFLKKAAKKNGKITGIGFRDLMSFLAGNSVGGPLLGVGGALADRALRSPQADLIAGRAIQGIGKAASTASRAARAPLMNTLISKTQGR